ncbi:MAG: NAD(P)H-hydrate epimerase [Eubacteriales bacterium]|nr:NAD(P)H-hydrate epimerase [Eubacteriales bacterium]
MKHKDEVVTCAEMKEIERKAAQTGLSYYQMMENAGIGAAELIMSQQTIKGKRVLIFYGKGNNGGDGFVVARKLCGEGAVVKLVLVDGEPKTEDAIKNREVCQNMQIPTLPSFKSTDWEKESLSPDIIVDAIYGTGFRGELEGEIKKATRFINHSPSKVYALDIPSGLNGDTGKGDEDGVRADCTIAFHRFKPAHLKVEAEKYCGESVCVDIGINL